MLTVIDVPVSTALAVAAALVFGNARMLAIEVAFVTAAAVIADGVDRDKALFRVTLRRTLVGSPCHFRVEKEARVFCRVVCHVMKTLFDFHMEDRRVLDTAYSIGRSYCSPILFSSTTLHHRSSAPCSNIGLAFENCGQYGRPTVWPRASPDLTQDADSLH